MHRTTRVRGGVASCEGQVRPACKSLQSCLYLQCGPCLTVSNEFQLFDFTKAVIDSYLKTRDFYFGGLDESMNIVWSYVNYRINSD
jgi:hypothetical protein